MAAQTLRAVQKIPVSLEQAWEYFSSPANLQAITPSQLGFKILSAPYDGKMYAGQIIEYTVAPLAGIGIYWMTEITHVQAMEYFVDEQRYGPYAMWHHEHHFRGIEGGVEMRDLIYYRVPFRGIGKMVNPLMVRPRLKKIFEYRFDKIEEMFGKWEGQERRVEMG